jgi:hypothetical protein
MTEEKAVFLESIDYIIEITAKFINAKTAKVVRQGTFKIGVRDFKPETGKVCIVGFPERETSSQYLDRVIDEANFVGHVASHAKWLAENQKGGKSEG